MASPGIVKQLLAGFGRATRNCMEGKEEMKCYDWFFCTKKISKETVLDKILKK